MRVTVFYVSETFCDYYSQRSVLNAAQLLKKQNKSKGTITITLKPDLNTSVSAHTKKNHMAVILVHTDVTSNEKKK